MVGRSLSPVARRWCDWALSRRAVGFQNLRLQRQWLSFLFTGTWGKESSSDSVGTEKGVIWDAGWQLPWLGFAKVAGGAPGRASRAAPGSWKQSICHEEGTSTPRGWNHSPSAHSLSLRCILTLTNQIWQLEFHNSHSRTLFVSKITFGNNLSRPQPISVWKPPEEVQLRKFNLPVCLSLCLFYSLVSNLFSEWSDFSLWTEMMKWCFNKIGIFRGKIVFLL